MKIKLQKILDDRKISIYSLSKEIGVTQNNLSKIVKGETTSIKYDILESLCMALNVTPNDIFEIRSPQLTFSDLNNTFHHNPKLITGDEVLQEQNNIYVSDEETFNHEIQQVRLNLEYEIETNLNTIIDHIIADADNSIYHDEFKDEIRRYFKIQDLPISFKITHSNMYRLVYTILSSQDKTELLAFLTRMRNIYAHGGLMDLNEDELIKISYTLNDYINKSCSKSKPNNRKSTNNSINSMNTLKKIDIYNEYNNNKKD